MASLFLLANPVKVIIIMIGTFHKALAHFHFQVPTNKANHGVLIGTKFSPTEMCCPYTNNLHTFYRKKCSPQL